MSTIKFENAHANGEGLLQCSECTVGADSGCIRTTSTNDRNTSFTSSFEDCQHDNVLLI